MVRVAVQCDCGNLLAGPADRTVTCRLCSRVSSLAHGTPIATVTPALTPRSPLAIARRAVCDPCPHRIDETCGLLRAQGKPGHLWHPAGLPNPNARFPTGCPLESSL